MEQKESGTGRFTVEEYFAMEEQSPVRHEYFEGQVFAMAGGTKAHNLIKGNLIEYMRPALRKHGCQLFDEAVKLATVDAGDKSRYTYPDIMVSCDPADRQDPQVVRQPILIIEVLSPSTAEYDRSLKFLEYQKLSSLQHYLLVSQTKWLIEWYRCEERGWFLTILAHREDVLQISDLHIEVSLAQIYEDTDVAPLQVETRNN